MLFPILKKDMVEDAVLNPEGAFMLFDDGLAYKHELPRIWLHMPLTISLEHLRS